LDACDFAPFVSKPTLCQTEPHKDWDGPVGSSFKVITHDFMITWFSYILLFF